MDGENEMYETIIACRTCGIHYVTPSEHQLKHLFHTNMEHSEIMLIRLELARWNVEVTENDGFPQHVCITCIHKFEKLFELRASCINAQNEFRKFYNVPNGNLANIKVKTELPDINEEQPICDFIYVDDLSDTEYDGATPFNIPHVPIKEEVIEAATIPMEESQSAMNIVESAASVVNSTNSSLSSAHIPHLMPQNESAVTSSPVISANVVQQTAIEQVECKLCQHLSPSQEEHKQHLQRAHEIRDMECHICGKQFKNCTPARLKFHMKWHTLNKHIKCTLCGFVCNSKDALREHKRANHSKINCKICGKGVLAKKMKSHLRQHEHDLLPKFNCEYCTESFDTEEGRETHIWQIHANEDNNASTSYTATSHHDIKETHLNNVEQHEIDEILYQETEDDLMINYKFLCAHCDQRFVEQIDLETHVNEEHRSKSQLTNVAVPTTNNSEEPTAQMPQPDHMDDIGHTNITVFEDYDNEAYMHLPENSETLTNNSSNVSENFETTSTNSQYLTETADMENVNHEEAVLTPEYHTETASNYSSDEKGESTDEAEESHQTDDAEMSETAYNNTNLNHFACAKCTETFATIEQLRQHHQQHLAADQLEQQQQQQQRTSTPNKFKFKCNLCGKMFNLKFSLNRHVSKHKHAPL